MCSCLQAPWLVSDCLRVVKHSELFCISTEDIQNNIHLLDLSCAEIRFHPVGNVPKTLLSEFLGSWTGEVLVSGTGLKTVL